MTVDDNPVDKRARNTTCSLTGALAIHRNMVLDIPFVADLETIRNNRQQLIDNRLTLANRKHFSYDYVIGDEVLKIAVKPNKLDPRNDGPFTITQVHMNGTVTLRLAPHVTERISLRHIKPYHHIDVESFFSYLQGIPQSKLSLMSLSWRQNAVSRSDSLNVQSCGTAI